MKTDILIVGGGPAGILAGQTAKGIDPELKITMVKDEPGIIIRCSEPYVIGGEVKLNDIIHSDDEMIGSKGITVLVDRVTGIDYKRKTAWTRNNREISFDRLILATGAKPFIPRIQGNKLKNVFTLRNAEDTKNLKRVSDKAENAVIIGGGAIGVEVGSLLRKKGLNVTIVEIASQLLAGAYDEEFSQKVELVLREKGINVLLGRGVSAIKGEKNVEEVLIEGERIPADFVVISAGVRADTELAEEIGCRIGRFGIKIDKYCRTSLSDVYACGDCAQSLSFITKKPVPSQLATTAVLEGKIAGANAAGKREEFPRIVNPSVTAFFDSAIGRVGLTEKQARDEGIPYVVGYGKSLNKYPSQREAEFIENKLVFEKETKRLIGAQVFGGKEGIDERIDLLSLAIHKGVRIEDLCHFSHCAHPELSPLPFTEPIVLAAEDALNRI